MGRKTWVTGTPSSFSSLILNIIHNIGTISAAINTQSGSNYMTSRSDTHVSFLLPFHSPRPSETDPRHNYRPLLGTTGRCGSGQADEPRARLRRQAVSRSSPRAM